MPDPSLERLRSVVADIGPAVVAFSGGVDSALVAWVTHDVLGPDRALAVTAVSPSLPDDGASGLRGAGRVVGPAVAGGRDRRDDAGRLPAQRP